MSAIVRRSARPIADLPTLRALMEDVCAGIRVLQSRDGVELTDEQILDRARNIVMGLVGNYRIVSLEPRPNRASSAATAEQLDLLPPAPTSARA